MSDPTTNPQLKRCSRGDKCIHPNGPILPKTGKYFNIQRQKGHIYYSSRCRICNNAWHRDYTNTPKWKLWHKSHYEEHIKPYQQTEEYRKKHAEKAHAYHQTAKSKAWEKERRQSEHSKAYHKAYRTNLVNKERQRLYQIEYRKDPQHKKRHNEAEKALRKASYATGVGQRKARAAYHRHYAVKFSLPSDFSASDWQFCLEYFKYSCAVCGRNLNYTEDIFGTYRLSVDHWIPISSPDCPGTIPSNIVPLCHGYDGCNNSKNNRDPHEWLLSRYGIEKVATIEKRIQRYFKTVHRKRE